MISPCLLTSLKDEKTESKDIKTAMTMRKKWSQRAQVLQIGKRIFKLFKKFVLLFFNIIEGAVL